jgi:hypothetical protein
LGVIGGTMHLVFAPFYPGLAHLPRVCPKTAYLAAGFSISFLS